MLRIVGQRPGVTAGELPAASGINSGTLYAVPRRLVDEGQIKRVDLPSAKTGYALVADAAGQQVGTATSEPLGDAGGMATPRQYGDGPRTERESGQSSTGAAEPTAASTAAPRSDDAQH